MLFEVMIALLVFAVAAIGLAGALNSSLGATARLKKQAAIRRGLENLLAEARQRPKREEMILQQRDEAQGVSYFTELASMTLSDFEGKRLADLYDLRAVAEWQDGNETRRDVAHVYLHAPK